MKRVLYITRKEIPYKVKLFNELAKYCDLTVIFENSASTVRNEEWAKSETNKFKYIYLDKGIFRNHFLGIKLLLHTLKKYDEIIFGCVNEKCQIFNILIFKIFKMKYILNLDGESFFKEKNLKNTIKKFTIKGADKYLIAGEKSAQNLSMIVKNKKIYPYYFSSLSENEIESNIKNSLNIKEREDYILVVGQYFDYKGLDIAVDVAQRMTKQKFKFVGMGYRTNEFIEYVKQREGQNIEIIPFLQKDNLNIEYKKCKLLLLPSRKECWGLVVNEAASFGTPIVSTYGSGAAVEFLEEKYSKFLAKQNDVEDMYHKIQNYIEYTEKERYSVYLKEKTKLYSIEKSVKSHLKALNIE